MHAGEMRARMQAGECLFGLGVRLARSAEIAAVAKACGFHWLFVDMEHSALSIDTATQMCVAALDAGLVPLVRIPGYEPTIASRLLDNGAGGIVIPHVDRPEQVLPVVERCRFPPTGRRSIGGPLPQLGYATRPAAEHMCLANERTLIIPMIESPEAIANAGAIAAIDGVDALLFGSNDLAIEMGIPGDLANPRIEAAFKSVIADAGKHDKVVALGGIYTKDLLERYLPLGFRAALLGSDLALVLAGGRDRVATAAKIAGG